MLGRTDKRMDGRMVEHTDVLTSGRPDRQADFLQGCEVLLINFILTYNFIVFFKKGDFS